MFDFMNKSFKVCRYHPKNLEIDKFQDNTEVLPISGVLVRGFSQKTKQNKTKQNQNKTKQNTRKKHKQTNKQKLCIRYWLDPWVK